MTHSSGKGISLDRETVALIGSVIFIAAIFAYPTYNYFVPHEVVWTGKIFGAYPAGGGSSTYIISYGQGQLILPGQVQLDAGSTYRIVYLLSGRSGYYGSDKVVSVTKVG